MFIGHQTNWKRLTEEAKAGRLPAAYLFYGLPGIGKKLVATAFAQHLFGKSPASHPDFYLIEPDEKGTIKIDPLRNLKKNLMKAPLEAPLKVVLIDSAGDMTPQAANSLLKVLEEPPPLTLFILITQALYGILPTIRSRCRLLFFSSPPVKEMAAKLAPVWGISVEEAALLLAEVDGSAGLALRIREEGFAEVSGELNKILTQKKSFSAISDIAQHLAQKEIDAGLILEILKKKLFVGGHNLDAIDKIKKAQEDLERNVNRTLVLENLLMDI